MSRNLLSQYSAMQLGKNTTHIRILPKETEKTPVYIRVQWMGFEKQPIAQEWIHWWCILSNLVLFPWILMYEGAFWKCMQESRFNSFWMSSLLLDAILIPWRILKWILVSFVDSKEESNHIFQKLLHSYWKSWGAHREQR